MENGRQLVLGDYFVQSVGHPVVGKESLHRRMKLEALDAALFDEAARLAHTHLAPNAWAPIGCGI
jgi:hypothetical protein